MATGRSLLQRALDALSQGADGCGRGVSSHMHLATLAFNRARLMEASGEFKAAAQLYKVWDPRGYAEGEV